MIQGKSIIVSAPSGAGKTTIVHQLLQHNLNLEFSISACSRAQRPNEVHGKDYYFLGVDGFQEKIKNNELFEWEEVYTNQYYGTLNSELQRIWNNNKHIIFDVDVVGGLNLKSKFNKNALAIFIMPPTVEELEKRLRNRSTETEEKIQTRLNKAQQELARANEFDVVIVNDELEVAVQETIAAVQAFLNHE